MSRALQKPSDRAARGKYTVAISNVLCEDGSWPSICDSLSVMTFSFISSFYILQFREDDANEKCVFAIPLEEYCSSDKTVCR